MRIRWAPHSERRLQERQLTIEEVEATIIGPDQRFDDPTHPWRRIAQTRVATPDGPVLLRVFYEELVAGEEVTVVTCYRTSKVEKYWRTDL